MIGISGLYSSDKKKIKLNPKLPNNDTEFKFKIYKNNNLSISYLNKRNQISHFQQNNIFSICLGDVEHNNTLFEGKDSSKILFNYYKKNKISEFLEKSGNFIFLIIDGEKLIIGKSKNSIIPFFYYYNKKNFIFSYELINVQSNIDKELDFNLYKFGQLILTNGVVLDNETIFKKINFLFNGEILTINQNKISFQRKSYFTYHPKFEKINYHLENVSNNLKLALNKLDKNNTFNLGLSGGLDSRILLAYLKNQKFKFQTHIYGMNQFDEAKIVNKISKFYKIKHDKITVKQKDYLNDSYMSTLISNFQCTINSFPQRLIYKNLSKKYKNHTFLFGTALDCTMGDAWQTKETMRIKSKKKLIEYFRKKHVFKFNQKEFSNFFLDKSLSKDIYEESYEKIKSIIFKINSDDCFDITSSFFFECRGKRWYNNSLVYPLYYCDIKNPFYDRNLLNSLSIIPSKLRANDYFRIKFLGNADEDLSKIIYNKSMTPANAEYPQNKEMIQKINLKEEKKFQKWIKSGFNKKFSSSRYDANFREWLVGNSKINLKLNKYFQDNKNILGRYFNLIYFYKYKKMINKKLENLKTIIIFLSLSSYLKNIKVIKNKNDK